MTPAADPGPLDVVVVGAGLAGLAAAQALHAAGQRVAVLDKSRGVSGRAATRRLTLPDGTQARLDHGARFFTARHPRTQALVQAGQHEGWLREWARSFALWEGGQVSRPADGHPRYAPLEGLSALGKHLAQGLDIRPGVTVTRLERGAHGWQVHDASGVVARAGTMLLNLPAPQLGPLLTGLDVPVPDVTYAPTWAAGVVLRADVPGADWPALELRGHPVLDWVAREQTKRPPGHPPALMLHAGADWSRTHLERRPEAVLPDLLAAAGAVLGLPLDGAGLDVAQAFAHRWRYATPERRAVGPGVWQAGLRLGLCGDGFTPDDHGPRVEAALLSGWWLAEQVGTEQLGATGV